MDFRTRSRNVVILDSIVFAVTWTVVIVCHYTFRNEYLEYWMLHIGINVSAHKLGLFLILGYVGLGIIWISLTILLHLGLKQRSSIKLLFWSLLHFAFLAPYLISAFFVILYNYKLFPTLVYVVYRGFTLWIVNDLNNEVVRQRHFSRRVHV